MNTDIREKREAAGISQAELARRIGMHQPKLSRIENGHIAPTAGESKLIEAVLLPGVPVYEGPTIEWVEPETRRRLASYPATPIDSLARRAWFDERNKNMQTRGVPGPSSGTFGAQPKKPKV